MNDNWGKGLLLVKTPTNDFFNMQYFCCLIILTGLRSDFWASLGLREGQEDLHSDTYNPETKIDGHPSTHPHTHAHTVKSASF